MANCCSFKSFIELNNKYDKMTLFENFEKDIKNSIFEINKDKAIFDCKVFDNCDNQILVVGWVKWGLDKKDVVDFFKYLNNICFIQDMKIELFEIGNGVCGKYIYNYEEETNIKYNYLPYDVVLNIIKDSAADEYDAYDMECKCFEEMKKGCEMDLIKIS